jgi:hypothetical protein
MSDGSLSVSKFFLKNSVGNAERNIVRKGGTVTAGKVLAEQSLGFWTSFFEKHHYRLVGGVVIHCFPHKPANVNRRILSPKLDRIRDFRNRIYHNEPICFTGNQVDFSYAARIRNELYELLDWIDGDLSAYVKTFDSIDSKINTAKSI